MASKMLRASIYLLVVVALFFFGLALALEFGVRTIPLGSAYVVDLNPSPIPTRIGLLVSAMAALLFMVDRLTLKRS